MLSRADLSARLGRALGKIKHGATPRARAPQEKSEYDLINDLKKERGIHRGYKRLIRRLRARRKRLESQDPNIYPLW